MDNVIELTLSTPNVIDLTDTKYAIAQDPMLTKLKKI